MVTTILKIGGKVLGIVQADKINQTTINLHFPITNIKNLFNAGARTKELRKRKKGKNKLEQTPNKPNKQELGNVFEKV